MDRSSTASRVDHLRRAGRAWRPTSWSRRACPPRSPADQPIGLDSPASPVEVVHGSYRAATCRSRRPARPGTEDAALTFGSLPLPPGTSRSPPRPSPAKFRRGGLGDRERRTRGPARPRRSIALTAKGPIAGKDRTLGDPEPSGSNVVRPAAVRAGRPFGRGQRPARRSRSRGRSSAEGPFKEPVTIKVDGLPAGLKADR